MPKAKQKIENKIRTIMINIRIIKNAVSSISSFYYIQI